VYDQNNTDETNTKTVVEAEEVSNEALAIGETFKINLDETNAETIIKTEKDSNEALPIDENFEIFDDQSKITAREIIKKVESQSEEKKEQIQKKEAEINKLQEEIKEIEASKFTSDSPLAQQDKEEKTRLE
jgi:hypothetical protein